MFNIFLWYGFFGKLCCSVWRILENLEFIFLISGVDKDGRFIKE